MTNILKQKEYSIAYGSRRTDATVADMRMLAALKGGKWYKLPLRSDEPHDVRGTVAVPGFLSYGAIIATILEHFQREFEQFDGRHAESMSINVSANFGYPLVGCEGDDNEWIRWTMRVFRQWPTSGGRPQNWSEEGPQGYTNTGPQFG